MQSKILISLFVALLATSISHLHAQTSDGKKREVGVSFSSINFDGSNSFNAFYKKEKRENVYRRINFAIGGLGLFGMNDNTIVSFNAGMSVGREKRKTLDRKLQFYRGPVFSFNTSFITGDIDDARLDLSAGLGIVFGLQHSFNELWAINLETIPSLNVGLNVGDFDNNNSFALGVGGSNRVSLGIVRKF